MSLTPDPSTGVPDPDRPGFWLVGPCPRGATFCDVVSHFLSAYVHGLINKTSTAQLLAYFQGYAAALAGASTSEFTCPVALRWRDDMLNLVARCVDVYSERRHAELEKARHNVRPLPTGTRLSTPPRQHLRERAS